MPRRKHTIRDPRKVSVDLPAEMIEEITGQAKRLDRSISKIVQIAWTIAKNQLRGYAPDIAAEAAPAPESAVPEDQDSNGQDAQANTQPAQTRPETA